MRQTERHSSSTCSIPRTIAGKVPRRVPGKFQGPRRFAVSFAFGVVFAIGFALPAPVHAARMWVPIPVQKDAALSEIEPRVDLARGETLARKCIACHALGPTAQNGIGPHLNGILGRRAASSDNYEYSKSLATAGEEGLAWTKHFLSDFLRAPNEMLPGNKMAFTGLIDAAERADLIGYLATFKAPEPALEVRAPAGETPSETDAPASDR